jgi:hypothetical protein
MPMSEPRVATLRGEFWLPDASKRHISGAVEFGPTLAGRLVLDGELFPGFEPVPLVHGSLVDGRPITAIDCYAAGRRTVYTDRAHVRQTVDAMTLLIGAHVGEQPRFIDLAVRLTLLSDWANVRSGWGSAERDELGYSIRYEVPPERTASIADGRIVRLRTVDRITTSTSVIHGEQETLFSVSWPGLGSLADVGEAVGSLQNLLTFATRRPAKVVGLSVTCPEIFVAPGVDIERELELRTNQVSLESPSTEEGVSFAERDFLFLAPDSSEEFHDLLQRWVVLEERLGVVLDLFLSLLYAPAHHLENRVMNICQAAEGYHRRMLDYKVMPEEEHKALLKALMKDCPKARRTWLSGVLAHSNGPSFKVRIEGLVSKAAKVGTALASTFESYPKSLRDFRNLYAHWPEDLSVTPADRVPELVDFLDVTKIILDTCLLLDMGWTEAEASAALSEKRDYTRLLLRPQVEVKHPG